MQASRCLPDGKGESKGPNPDGTPSLSLSLRAETKHLSQNAWSPDIDAVVCPTYAGHKNNCCMASAAGWATRAGSCHSPALHPLESSVCSIAPQFLGAPWLDGWTSSVLYLILSGPWGAGRRGILRAWMLVHNSTPGSRSRLFSTHRTHCYLWLQKRPCCLGRC